MKTQTWGIASLMGWSEKENTCKGSKAREIKGTKIHGRQRRNVLNEGVINRSNASECNIRYGLMGIHPLFFKRSLVILNEKKNILTAFETLRINAMCMTCDNFSM